MLTNNTGFIFTPTHRLQNVLQPRDIIIDDRLREEFQNWLSLDFVDIKRCWKPKNPIHAQVVISMADASNYAAGLYVRDGAQELTRTLVFPEAIQGKGIAVKEAIAMLWCIQNFSDYFRNKHVRTTSRYAMHLRIWGALYRRSMM